MVQAQTGQVDQETLGKYESETNRLKAAEAEVASLAVQLKQARDDFQRAKELADAKWLSQQAMERARSTYHQTEENHRKAQSDFAAARGTLSAAGGSRSQVQVLERQRAVLGAPGRRDPRRDPQARSRHRRPHDREPGRRPHRHDVRAQGRARRRPGSASSCSTTRSEIWVEANVKETDVRLLKPGMKAEVRVDAYPGRVFAGEVFRIGQTATSKFALLPDPNPSGNFTKITQRLPVRILLTEKDPALRPGMMVEVDDCSPKRLRRSSRATGRATAGSRPSR